MTGPVVVGVDGSTCALDAVRWAAAEAARHNLPLHLVHAYLLPICGYPEIVLMEQGIREAIEQQGRGWLGDAESAAREEAPAVVVTTELVCSGAAGALTHRGKHASMIVLGAHGGGGFTGQLVGATAIAVAVHSTCPIVVVRGDTGTGGPVVVGVDGSPASEAAIAFAFAEASTRGLPLRAVMAWTDFLVDSPYGPPHLSFDWAVVEREQERLLAQRLAWWQEKYPDVHVERVVVRDRPVRALLAQAEHADLLVVGSHGHGGFTGMLIGSTSQALVYHAPCPVAVVRPDNTTGRGGHA